MSRRKMKKDELGKAYLFLCKLESIGVNHELKVH